MNWGARERRRMEGARLLRAGMWQAEVARRVGVRRQSVSRWARAIRDGGVWALKARRVGRRSKLHGEQWRRVEKQLRRGLTRAGEMRFQLKPGRGSGFRVGRRGRRGKPRLHTSPHTRGERRPYTSSHTGLHTWTLKKVAELIERECRVRYCQSGAWRLLERMGWRWGGGGWGGGR